MLEIKPERLAYYREMLRDLDVSDDRKDEVIRTLAWFMRSWVDRAFGVDPVQLAVKDRLSESFQFAALHGSVEHGSDTARIDLGSEGATTPKHNEREKRHDAISHKKGCDLL